MSKNKTHPNTHPTSETTDFGYQRLPIHEKAPKVADVFNTVAHRYDLMNDLMSLGLHRLWKRTALSWAQPKPNDSILDLAGGTGDLTEKLAKIVRKGQRGQVVLADINAAMLKVGRNRLLNQGFADSIRYIQTDAESLPFPKNTFDCVIMGFGLRNVTRKEKALDSLFHVLKPGGRVILLEFSPEVLPGLSALYELYSFKVIPKLGQWIAGDASSYRYLVESIRKHPEPGILKQMMEAVGFEGVHFIKLSGGIVAIHKGYKY